jgi:hypothetical protein
MLYSEVQVSEPLDKIAADWDYLSDKVIQQFYGFKDVGDNVVGIRSIERATVADYGQKAVPVALPAVRKNYEIGPQGMVEVPRTPFSMHVTLAGTPHRTQHVFGYWHINDKDEIIIPLPPDGDRPGRVLIVMGKPTANETDRFAWYCEKCLTLLFLRESTDFSTFGRRSRRRFKPIAPTRTTRSARAAGTRIRSGIRPCSSPIRPSSARRGSNGELGLCRTRQAGPGAGSVFRSPFRRQQHRLAAARPVRDLDWRKHRAG